MSACVSSEKSSRIIRIKSAATACGSRHWLLHSVNSEEALHSAQRAVRHLRGLDFPLDPQVLP
jgi:hypothetical protein